MKKLIVIIAAMSFIFGCSMVESKRDFKKVACEESCKAILDKCKEKAGDNEAKKIACETAYNKCKEDCK